MYILYIITNTGNGKVYIGQTSKSAEERWKDHCWSSAKRDYFHYAIRKYGREAFVVQTLAEVETAEEINRLEQCWIAAFRSHDKFFGYNTTLGGENGATPTEEVRRKIAHSHRGLLHSAETRQQMSESRKGEKNAFFGKRHKPESVEAAREKLKVLLGGENNPWFGKTLSEEHRLNISRAKKGKKLPPRSEETCRRLSEAATRRWARQQESQLSLTEASA